MFSLAALLRGGSLREAKVKDGRLDVGKHTLGEMSAEPTVLEVQVYIA